MQREALADTITEMSKLQYQRELGGHRPNFEGAPDDFYPLGCGELCKYILAVVCGMLVGLGIMIGFIYWVVAGGLTNYIIVWVAFTLFFVTLLLILFYFGGKNRITQEKVLLLQARKKQQLMRNKNKDHHIHNQQQTQLKIIDQI